MTPLAALFMCVSVASVVALTAWCYYRVLTQHRRDAKTPSAGKQPD